MSFGGKFPGRVVQSKMGGFEPDLISNLPGMEAAGCSGGHEFLSGVMSSKGLLLSFIELGKSFFESWKESLSQSRIRVRFIAVKEGEWGCFCGAMRGGVVVEFYRGKELYPFSRVVGTKDVEICFKLLIGSLSLTICLWVIGSRQVNIILEEVSEFLGKGGGKLRTTVGDESVM